MHFTMDPVSTHNCVICENDYEGMGHNAAPVMEGRCCTTCNYKVVIPHRINMSQLPNIYN